MSGRRLATLTAAVVLAIGSTLLAMWLSGIPDLVRLAAWRGKTNTCVALVACGLALLALARGTTRRAHRIQDGFAGAALAVGALTLLQYLAGVDLGIDELIVHDWPYAESAAHPNRMSPNAAASFVLIGAALLAVRRRPRIAHAIAIVVLAFDAVALIGYAIDASFLYRASTFLRISPYAALCFVLLAVGVLASIPEVGIVRFLRRPSVGAFTVRRLIIPVVGVPVLASWFGVSGEAAGWWGRTGSVAIHVIAGIALYALVAAYLARTLDVSDEKRHASELELRRVAELTAALSRAMTVEEVGRAAADLGVVALAADAGAVFLVEPEGTHLRMLATHGYPPRHHGAYARVPVDARLPVCEAFRAGGPVFVTSLADFQRRYPQVPDVDPATQLWAALPLEARGRLLGAIGLSYRTQVPEVAARARVEHLTALLGQALDRALLFEEVQRARDAERDANQAKDAFLAMLGHELRNPLAPITQALELMSLRDPRPSRERVVIERQVRHLTRLVEDLLDVSRIASGKIELRREAVEVAALLHDAAELVAPLVEERHHELAVTAEPGLVVEGDRARLIQIVSNLLNNAARYTPPRGRIAVTARRDGDAALIEVADNGAGIPAALVPRLFDPFVQGDRSIERAAGGLGLGLAIVKSLVHLHDGTIEVDSAGEGEGTRFVLRFPAREAAPVAAEAAPALAPATAAKRVLIVDDNQDAAELMAESLSLAGHAVRVAFDGARALAIAGEHEPDCVMLDIGLPVLDGYEVARRLRERDAATGRRRVLVAMTGYGQPEDIRRSTEAGFDRHLVKPVSIAVALDIVANLRPAP